MTLPVNEYSFAKPRHSDDVALDLSSHRCLCARLSTSLISPCPVSDGSFCIQFPANYPGDDSGRIWYVCICLEILFIYAHVFRKYNHGA